ncbi:MAG: UbiA family prenyltransferase [Candidatus Micrarchaeota archaeon]
MARLSAFIQLMRPQQWYKNLIFFTAFIFSKNLANSALYAQLALGFASLCLASSANYAINDILDMKNDARHPEKKNRPLPSGKIKAGEAYFFALILLIASLALAYSVSLAFFAAILLFFTLTQIYSFRAKNIVFADIVFVSTNFVIRAISGALAINVVFSPWLVLCSFLLALFISASKRLGDLLLLGKEAWKYKQVFKYYTPELLGNVVVASMAMLLLSYSNYSFLSTSHDDYIMMATIPIAAFLVFRYTYLLYSRSPITRSPEKVFKDGQMFFGVALWLALVLLSLYINHGASLSI